MSGCSASVSPIKLLKPKKSSKDQMKPPLLSLWKRGTQKRAFFNPQKHKVIDEISKSEGDHQECIIKKVKSNDENNDFSINRFYYNQ